LAGLVGDNATYNQYIPCSAYYKNVWDASNKVFRSKNSSGAWGTIGADLFEGNEKDYAYAIPHDPYGLIGLYGSDQAIITSIMGFLNTAWYNDYQLMYQYIPLYANSPGDAQWASRKSFLPLFDPNIIAEGFSNRNPWGCYYEDNAGAVVLTMLGLYYMPTPDQFVINSPSFTKAILHLKNGDVTVNAPNNDANNIYIQSLKLNGARFPSYMISGKQLATAGAQTFDMTMSATAGTRIGNLYLGSSDALVSSAASDNSSWLDFTVDPIGITDCKAKVYSTVAPTAVKLNGTPVASGSWSYASATKVLTVNNLSAGTYRVEVGTVGTSVPKPAIGISPENALRASGNVQIINPAGRVIKNAFLDRQTDLKSLFTDNGVYFIRTTQGNKSVMEKIMVCR
jgi:hypothetical protein